MKAFVIGGVSYDHIIHLNELPNEKDDACFASESYFMVGGTGAGKALNLSQLGFETTFQFRIGADEPGQHIQTFFASRPIDTLVDIDTSGTECHSNLMLKNGQRKSIYTQYLTFDPDIDSAPVVAQARNSDVIFINIINYCRHYLTDLKTTGKPIWVDIHDFDGHNEYHRDFIDAADILFLSSEQMPHFRAFMVEQMESGKTLVVCTHGKDGATCLTKEGHWYEQPIIDGFTPVDTNGAGDAFMAGFAFGYCHQQPIQTCLEYGAIAAGHTIEARSLVNSSLSPRQLMQESVL